MGHTGVRALQDLLPAALLCAGALLCAAPGLDLRARRGVALGTLGLFAASPLLFLRGMPGGGWRAFGDGLLLDRLSAGAAPVLAASAAVAVGALPTVAERLRPHVAEVLSLLLLAVLGAWLAVAAGETGELLAALGLLLVCLAVLAGLAKTDGRSTAAALHLLLLGTAALAVLAIGLAIVAALTGTTGFRESTALVAGGTAGGAAAAILCVTGVLLLVAAALSASAEAVPGPIAGAIAGLPVVALACVLERLCVTALAAVRAAWTAELVTVAVLLVVLGSVRALGARDIRPVIAALTVTSTGAAVLGFAAAAPGDAGPPAVLVAAAATGLAAVVAHVALASITDGDVAGLAARAPLRAGVLALALLSLAGAPPLMGFLGRLATVTAAVSAGWAWTLVLVLPATVAGIAAAARWVRVLVAEEPSLDALPLPRHRTAMAVLTAAGVVVLLAAVAGEPLFAAAAAGAGELR